MLNILQVAFRNAVAGTLMRNYWNNGQAIAFSRDDVGFFAMAKNGFLNANLQTGKTLLSPAQQQLRQVRWIWL